MICYGWLCGKSMIPHEITNVLNENVYFSNNTAGHYLPFITALSAYLVSAPDISNATRGCSLFSHRISSLIPMVEIP